MTQPRAHREYVDFELRIGEQRGGRYPVTVLRSAAGEVDLETEFSLADQAFRDRLDRVARGSVIAWSTEPEPVEAGTSGATLGAVPDPVDVDRPRAWMNVHEEVGRDLFNAVFRDEILGAFRVALDRARREAKGLRLRLRLDAPEIAVLPWELLYDGAEGRFLGLDPMTPIVRHPEVARAVELPPRPRPLRILGLIASPTDQVALDVEGERQRIEKALDHLIETGDLELCWVEGQTVEALRDKLEDGPWHVLHFIGHGGFDEAGRQGSGEGHLILADTAGNSRRLDAGQLGTLLEQRPELRLVVLNSCEGARASAENLFSSTGTILARRGIPAVISMQDEISDDAAIEFARAFYTALAAGKPFDEATALARHAIDLALSPTFEWATPVFHLRLPDGFLFARESLRALAARGATPAPASFDRRTFDLDIDSLWPPSVILTTSASRRPRAERDLLAKVRGAWSDDQGVDDAAQTLNASLASPLRILSGDEGSLQPARRLIDGARALVILGDPGADLTSELRRLVGELIAHAERDPRLPIPVVLPLAESAGLREGFEDWILEALASQFQLPESLGRRWLDRGLLLPLLDGFHGVGTARRPALATALAGFLEHGGRFVLTAERHEYEKLPAPLAVDAVLLVEPLDDHRIFARVEAAGRELADLAAALKRDSVLRLAARSPLMLGFMMQMARHLPVATLTGDRFASALERRRQVVEAFVDHRFQEESAAPHDRESTVAGLAWLARGLERHGRNLFLIEHLQTSWLESSRRQLASCFSFDAVLGALMGLLAFAAWNISSLVDPPEAPTYAAIPLPWWLVVTMLWTVGIDLVDRFQPRASPSSPAPLKSPRSSVARRLLGGALYFVLWVLLWTVAWLVERGLMERAAQWQDWMHQPLTIGGALVVLVVVRLRGARDPDRVRPVEALGWSWRFAVIGGVIGAGAAILVWNHYFLTSRDPLAFRLDHLRFYLPFAVTIGLVFGGLRMRFWRRKSRPNEGIRLSSRNAFLGAVIGLVTGPLAFVVALVERGFDGFPGLATRPWLLPDALLQIALLTAGIAALWYGGLEVLRHYILRAFLAAEVPRRLRSFLDHAVRLGFLDRVGGGYLFIHRFIRDHFAEQQSTRR